MALPKVLMMVGLVVGVGVGVGGALFFVTLTVDELHRQ